MSRRGYRKDIVDRQFFKNRLIRRDGAVCAICGEPISSMHDVTLDHILPMSRGGMTVIENLQLAHETCNRTKRDMTPDEWEEWRELAGH